VDWALLRLTELTGKRAYHDAAIKHLRWTLGNQQKNGWFEHCGFTDREAVTTHTLSYTTQGLIECGKLLGDESFIHSASLAAEPLLDWFYQSAALPGAFSPDWCPIVNWECLTGNAQTSIVWQDLAQLTGQTVFGEASRMMNQRMLRFQKVQSRMPAVDGGILGSWPINGDYDCLSFPNHAAKFHVDAVSKEFAWRSAQQSGEITRKGLEPIAVAP